MTAPLQEPRPPLDLPTLRYILALEELAAKHPMIRRDKRSFSATRLLLGELQPELGGSGALFDVATTDAVTVARARLYAWLYGDVTRVAAEGYTDELIRQDVERLADSHLLLGVQLTQRGADLLEPLRRAVVATILTTSPGRVRLALITASAGLVEREGASLDEVLSGLVR